MTHWTQSAWAPALVTIASAAACAAAPVGTVDGRVPSRFVGEPMVLAGETRRTANVPRRTYEVKKGDTLYSLARRFNTTVDQLMEANGIESPENMRIGLELVVPQAPGGSLREESTKIKVVEHKPKGSLKPGSRYAFAWPVEGEITSRYGHRSGRNHDGIDIAAPKGSPVRAAADGEVLYSASKGGYGKLVLIRHDNGLITVYAHNDINLVRAGQRVRAGQSIAKVGQTGRATGPHLHFEVRRGVKPENPLSHLPP